jgi:DNA-directed RNA polymerase specialized sigma24 family protein
MSNSIENQSPPEPGFECKLVERYTERLLDLARRRLPDALRRRLDPEDVVQSVYRSFFQRLREGRFSFDDSGDLWRLLAAMTFQKACEAGKFHQRQRRDARRDRSLAPDGSANVTAEPATVEPGPDDLAALVECMDLLVARLPEKYRDIAVHRLNGDSVEEIAGKVNRTTRTVFRALADMESLAIQLMRGHSS